MSTAPIATEDTRFKETSRSSEILEIASRLFYENGYTSVGMRTIAEEVGISAATIYHHFKSKDDMLFQIALGVTRKFVEVVLPILQDAAGDRALRMKTFIVRHIEFRWYRRYWISTTLRDLRALPASQQAEVVGYLRYYQDTIRDFIQAGINAGEFDVPDASLAGLALIDMIHGINNWFSPDGKLTITEVAQAYADMVVDNLLGAGR